MPTSKAEILLGSTWTDVTSRVRYEGGVSVRSGQTGETSRVEPSTCDLALNNRDGRFSPRNPSSPYYGLLVKGTRLRTSVRGPYMHLRVNRGNDDAATTPDHSSLDITGDLDVRLDAALDDWGELATIELMGKEEATGDQRSWGLWVSNGFLFFEWSSDGTAATIKNIASTARVPSSGVNRLSVRITLDVNNGSGGHTATFYTGTGGVGGSWTQLGDPVVGTGTTSIFASSAPLHVGAINDMNNTNPRGMIYAAQVRSGIGGSVVANPDFTIQAEGTTSFADIAGRVWTVAGTASITRYIPRFYGEINDIQVSGNQAATDSSVRVQASDLTKRLGASSTPLFSPLRQELSSPTRQNIVAYWPLEDAAGSSSMIGLYQAGRMKITGSLNFGTSTQWMGSAALPSMGNASLSATVGAYTTTSETSVRMQITVPSGGVASTQDLLDLYGTGSAVHWKLTLNSSGSISLMAFDGDGGTILNPGFISFGVNSDLSVLVLELTQSGSNINWRVIVQNYTNVTDITQGVPVATSNGTLTGNTVGRITRVIIGSDRGLGDVVVGHVSVANALAAYAITNNAVLGYAGELASARQPRICTANGLTFQPINHGQSGNEVFLGRQPVATVMDVLRDTADTDRGILYAARTHSGLIYRSRLSLYNQDPVVQLDCASGHIGDTLQPVDDDQVLANRVTVNRAFGSSAVVALDAGTLSTQDPPNGIGLREYSEQVSVSTDDALPQHANWILHQRTLDEARFPSITFKLHGNAFTNNAALMNQMLLTRIGDRVTVTGQPGWLPPDDISQIVVGFNEYYDDHQHLLTVVCMPESVYHVAVADGSAYERVDTDGSSLAMGAPSSTTTLTVATDDGADVWVDSIDYASDFPLDVRLGGEVVTATAITPSVVDTFARTTSNGWGTTSIGGTWTVVAGTTADFSTNGTYGVHSQPSTGQAHISGLTAPSADVDLYADIATSSLATGGSMFGGPCARLVNNNDFYMARLEFTTGQAIILSLRKRVSAAETALASFTTSLTHVAGAFYRVRFQVFGSTLRARVWDPAASREPSEWQVTVTDTSHTTANNIGIRSFTNAGNTNVNPQVRTDNFRIVNPQSFTVTRSVNGVVNAHTSGTDVALANPTFVPL
ncbi:hypothetical protein PV350_23475 [Streptomyces sp. PA03-6a]|nr:hypothetical protein [Streptomyces sp. PA03-6a]